MRRIVAVAVAVAAAALAGCGANRAAAPGTAVAARDAGPDGVLVLGALSPERAIVADPATGRTVQRVLPGGTLCRGPLRAAGGRVVWLGTRGDRPAVLSLPLALAGRARSLGRAESVTPAPGGSLWLGRWSARAGGGFSVSLRRLGADGGALARRPMALPSGSVLEAVAGDALVLTQGPDLVVWRDGRALRTVRGGWLLASAASRVAWCRGDCRTVTVWDPAGERSWGAPGSFAAIAGGRAALSPDGRWLAAVVAGGGPARVAVLDVAAGRWRVLRSAPVTGYRAIGWSPSGRWLYFTGPRRRIMAWRNGGGIRRLPVRTRGTVMTIAAVPRPVAAARSG